MIGGKAFLIAKDCIKGTEFIVFWLNIGLNGFVIGTDRKGSLIF